MKIPSQLEFRRICKSKISKYSKILLEERKKLYQVFLLALIISFLLVYLAIIKFNLPLQLLIMGPALALIPSIPKYNRYRYKFKKKLIRPILESIFVGIKYNEKSQFSLNLFNELSMFPVANRLDSEDQISGEFEGTHFIMAEVSARHVSEKNKRRRSDTDSDKSIFSGLLYQIEFNKNFSSHTVVTPDYAELIFGKLIGHKLQSLSLRGLKLVKLESANFEKAFKVRSDCNQDARYILTPSMMERITNIKKMVRSEIFICFKDDHLFLAIRKSKNYFGPKLFGEITEYKDLKEIYRLLEMLTQIINELDLNTRIWSKQ